ncbi:MAG TPA: molybdopterin cofactor-binding domain-containing protein [Xanthobacteraceae bacterium]|jgi:isoquinoline 1-oxidoreductase beta subunit|nr:molybdopterin cofactor-binding domain-containing protein [Xanthobacteraceae bacterium]
MNTHIDPANLQPALSRRQFMVGVAGLTFAIAIGAADEAAAAVPATGTAGKAISPWVSIAADGTISIMSPATEMGQGSMTSLPLIVAEELDADWSKVRVVPAPPVESLYGNPGFGGMMYTAGSNAVRSYYKPLRLFGAQVRRVLLDNAARKLAVPVAELTTEPSVIVHAKSGRRLTYAEIAGFAELPAQAPEIKPEELKKPSEFRLIGKSMLRVELPNKVNGSAIYSIDVQVPGMIYGAVLRAPVEGSTPESFDAEKAKAIAGVIDIVKLPYGIGVLAEAPYPALEAKEAIARTAKWTRTGSAWGFDSDAGLDGFAKDARDSTGPVTDWFKQGDAAAELQKAATVVEAEYRCDYAYHAQMEPLNAVAAISPAGDAVEIWCGTQSQTLAVDAVAKVLGIPREKVKLNYLLMGGGFGRRGHRDEEFIVDAVRMAQAAKRPVKVLWQREDDVHNGRFRPITAHYLRAGLDSSGKLVAWHQRLAGDRVTPYQDPVRYNGAGHKDFILMLGVELRSYDIPHQYCGELRRDTGVRTSSLRGIGFTANKFVTEAFLDEIATKRGIDPVQLRLELLDKTPRGRKVVETVARMADWGRKREGRGLGFAFIDYSDTLVGGIAEVSLDRASGKIRVHDFWCALDCGTEVQPENILAQTESSIVYGLGMALTERISIKDGAVEQSNFYDYFIPRMSDIPEIHIELVPTDNAPTGVGQMATPVVAPAIANAVAQLAGVRLRETPMTPERVKKAIG